MKTSERKTIPEKKNAGGRVVILPTASPIRKNIDWPDVGDCLGHIDTQRSLAVDAVHDQDGKRLLVQCDEMQGWIEVIRRLVER